MSVEGINQIVDSAMPMGVEMAISEVNKAAPGVVDTVEKGVGTALGMSPDGVRQFEVGLLTQGAHQLVGGLFKNPILAGGVPSMPSFGAALGDIVGAPQGEQPQAAPQPGDFQMQPQMQMQAPQEQYAQQYVQPEYAQPQAAAPATAPASAPAPAA